LIGRIDDEPGVYVKLPRRGSLLQASTSELRGEPRAAFQTKSDVSDSSLATQGHLFLVFFRVCISHPSSA
jgi:hypothetical protein